MMCKKLLLLALGFFYFCLSYGQSRHVVGGAIHVFSLSDPFHLYLNNVLYNTNPGKQISVVDLKDGFYDLRVEFLQKSRSSLTMQAVQVRNEEGYYLDQLFSADSRSRGGRRLMLFSMFPIGLREPNRQEFDRYSYGNPTVTNPSVNLPDHSIVADDRMSADEFNTFLASLKKTSFDDERLKLAELTFFNVSLTTQQIIQIMRLFPWDKEKLVVATKAYSNCLDKRNYSSVSALLTFDDARNSLSRFMQNQSIDLYALEEMSSSELEVFLKHIKSKGFDEEKNKLVKSVSATVAFSVADIRQILKQFNWDDDKLSVAKTLYVNCYDKRNYVNLMDVFAFKDSKDKFLAYIKSLQKN